MNMNKKILIFVSLFVLLTMFPIVAKANNACSKLNEANCENMANCKWANGQCMIRYVAENPCDENDIRKVLKIFGYIILIAKVAVPLIIIGFGTFDLFKSVVDKDEKSLGKQVKQLGIRVVAGIIVFFIPNFVNALFGISDKLNIIETAQFKTCASCLLDPTNEVSCSVID